MEETLRHVAVVVYHYRIDLYLLDHLARALARCAPSAVWCQCCVLVAFQFPYGAEPVQQPFLRRSGETISMITIILKRKSCSTFSWINSSFFASNSSFGTPCGFVWALRHRSHNSLQNLAVSLSRNPVSWI